MSLKKIRLQYVVLTVIWLGLIYYFSSQGASRSQNQSLFITNIVSIVFRFENSEILHGIIRKCAHAFEYFVLGFLLYNCVKDKRWMMICILLCFFFAGMDEFHQLFVPLRHGSILDVCLDGFSSFCSILLCHKILKF